MIKDLVASGHALADDMTGAPSVLVRCLAAQLEVQLVRANELAAENAAMHETIEAVRSVADNSSGIAGWHLNGDIATWEEILPEINDIETTATDAFLAEVRAQAFNDLCSVFVKDATVAGLDDGDIVTVKEATDALLHCAEQLRKGGNQ
ncbi:hypothetical protein EM846_06860 [Escherichia coli]|nr:hypothetical protein [Escherichia coli]